MKTLNGKMLGVSTILLIGMARVVFLLQEARAATTNDIETAVVDSFEDLAGWDSFPPYPPPVEEVLLNIAQRAGVSTQELARVLIHVATNTQNNTTVVNAAAQALGRLRVQEAFDVLRELSRKGRTDEIKGWAIWSVIQVAGNRLVPYAREMRDGKDMSEGQRMGLYGKLFVLLSERKVSSTNAPPDKAWDDQRAGVLSFLFESAGKETRPWIVAGCDRHLCEEVPEYCASVERQGFLQRAQMQCEEGKQLPAVWQKPGVWQQNVRKDIDQGLETLRRLPPDKRTSVKGLLAPRGGTPETELRK